MKPVPSIMTDDQKRTTDRKKRTPRKATASSLNNVALYYLQRFSSSSENLRRVLMKRVSNSAYHHDTDPEEGAAFVNDIIRRFVDSGLLDDNQYAENLVASLNQRGNSRRVIRGKLAQKGVRSDIIDAALDSLSENEPDYELTAAVRLARRRRLGPYRTKDDREERQEKDLAAMARSGFSYDMAKRVILSNDIDELEDEAGL